MASNCYVGKVVGILLPVPRAVLVKVPLCLIRNFSPKQGQRYYI